jgi:hypothetical protein
MKILYSLSSHSSCKSSGFFLEFDKNVPDDAFPITNEDHCLAINLQDGFSYNFKPPEGDSEYGVLVVIQPDDEYVLQSKKEEKLNDVQMAYNQALLKPVQYKSEGGITQTYQADTQSIANLQALLIGMASNPDALPDGFCWIAADNTPVPFTYADMQKLGVLMCNQGISAFSHLQEKKSEIKMAKKVADVISIAW